MLVLRPMYFPALDCGGQQLERKLYAIAEHD
jgi:hypothetical protein